MPATSFTYNDVSIREDLWDIVVNIDPIETYISSNAGTIPVTARTHEWLVDTLTAQSSQTGRVEGADTTYAVTDPTRLSNQTQIIEYGVKVSMTNENADHAGYKDRFATEQAKKMKEWKNQLEYSVLNGTLATGTGSAARTMKGIVAFASTLATQHSSTGVSLSEAMFNDYIGNAWSQGAEIDTVLANKYLKRKISGFTAGSTKSIDISKAELVGRVDIYDGDFGRVTVVKHRYAVTTAPGTYPGDNLVGFQSDLIKIGFLDKPHYEDRPAAGYFKAGSVVGEATVQVGSEKAVFSTTCLV